MTAPLPSLRSHPHGVAPLPSGRPRGLQAIVLFAHGARDARWAEPFIAIATKLRAAAPGLRVELAFLELMAPDLETALAALASEGSTRVDIVPLFLGTGGHLRSDLPPLIARSRAAHAGLDIRLHPAIGENAAVIDAIAAALALAAFGE
ncbi:MAG: CbiX/SirB N-terminal domain-containing protein [Caldimonas sp.]|nr:CbiX/SirB N-terminal domain-containing protein [Pseudomonadota bacterium]